MEKAYLKNIKRVDPYIPGEQPDSRSIVKLNTNECPFQPSSRVQATLREYDTGNLRLYPSIDCIELKTTLAETYSLKNEQIFLGNGSDEVLALAFLTFFNSKHPILFPNITYSFYDVWCRLFGIAYEQLPLDDKFEINIEDYKRENGGVVIANPNAPTGIFADLDKIEKLVAYNKDVIVIIDEAYIDFGGESAVKLLDKYDNLVVVHTFSKSRALAGIRVGYAMAAERLITALDDVKNSFNSYTINSLSALAAEKSAADRAYFYECTGKIIKTRQRVVERLAEIGFYTFPSSANFIFTGNDRLSAADLFAFLKKNDIYVRYFDKPLINKYLRVTIGTDEQMDLFLAAVEKYICQIDCKD